MQRTVELVISRYNEDITWSDRHAAIRTVYDKSAAAAPGSIQLQNKGRETDTYLRHIISKYPSFPDYTVFVQGRIDDHCDVNDFHETIKLLNSGWSTEPYYGLSRLWGEVLNYNCPYFGLNLREFWGKIGVAVPENYKCNYNAIFVVSREALLKYDLAFYEKLMEILHQDEVHGHMFERAWTALFSQ